jgi:predicted Zn-dependent protease
VDYPLDVYALRAIAWSIGSLAVPVLLGSAFGRRWYGIGALLAIGATVWLLVWLPRTAHSAFQNARFAKASRRYRLVGMFAFTRSRDRSAQLSRAGCEVATGRLDRAGVLLGDVDGEVLEPAERAVWLNNRACLLLDKETPDAPGALALADRAIELRPDVPAIQHTRGRSLLAVGRIDDAIAVLDAMRTAGELAPHLEAERCRDLAIAWEKKGEGEYASDYRARAQLVAR